MDEPNLNEYMLISEHKKRIDNLMRSYETKLARIRLELTKVDQQLQYAFSICFK